MTSTILFWICWAVEFVFMLWWLFDDMKLRSASINPMIPIGFIWLMGVLFVRLVLHAEKVSFIMVGITAIPLVIMGLYLLMLLLMRIFGGPIRWN